MERVCLSNTKPLKSRWHKIKEDLEMRTFALNGHKNGPRHYYFESRDHRFPAITVKVNSSTKRSLA